MMYSEIIESAAELLDSNARLQAENQRLREEVGHLLWLIEVEHKIDGQHITARARAVLEE